MHLNVKGGLVGDDCGLRLFPFPHGLLQNRSRNPGDSTECLRDAGEGVKWRKLTRPDFSGREIEGSGDGCICISFDLRLFRLDKLITL